MLDETQVAVDLLADRENPALLDQQVRYLFLCLLEYLLHHPEEHLHRPCKHDHVQRSLYIVLEAQLDPILLYTLQGLGHAEDADETDHEGTSLDGED